MERLVGEIYDNRMYLRGYSLGEPLSPVIRIFGDWAVTTYGIEHLTGTYVVEAKRVWEQDWKRHMINKGYDTAGFNHSLELAQTIFKENGKLKISVKGVTLDEYLDGKQPNISKINPSSKSQVAVSLRFSVLKRDKYTCQLCGKTAKHGAVLEVDHRLAKSKGGKDTLDNLWTLCFDCNRGKAAKEL